MKAKTVAVIVFSFVGLLAFAILWNYASIGIYHLLIKQMPQSLGFFTLRDLWNAYEQVPEGREQLTKAMGLSVGSIFALGFMGTMAAMNQKRALHGSARWANGGEINKAALNAEKGILIGKRGGQYLSFGGQQFVWVAAPTRSGKGVGIVIPNLLNWPDSAVVLDIKGENFKITSGFRAKHGQKVFVFNPFDREFSTHRWNPFAEISRDKNFMTGELLGIASSLYPTEGVKDAFWQEQAQNLFLGLSLYLIETEKFFPNRYCSMGELFRQGSGYGKPLQEHVRGLLEQETERVLKDGEEGISDRCINALNRFCSAPENTLGNIKSTFDSPLIIFTNPITDAATSCSDFEFKDLRSQRMTIYLVIPPNALALSGTARLLNLFFSQLLSQNLNQLPEDNPALKYQCLLLMDEFTSIGKIAVLAKGVSFIAGYGMRLLPIIQSMSQLVGVYGKEDARTISTNHAAQVVFPPRENADAKEISETLGTFTEKAVSTGRSGAGMFSKNGITMSENQSDQRRALMMPQELREMPQTESIVLMENTKPILCKKIRYYDDPTFMSRLLPAIAIPKLNMQEHAAFIESRTREVTADDLEAIASGTLKLMDDAVPTYVEGMSIDAINMDSILAAYSAGQLDI